MTTGEGFRSRRRLSSFTNVGRGYTTRPQFSASTAFMLPTLTDWAQVGGTFSAAARALDVDPVDSNRIYVTADNGIWVYDGSGWNQKTKTNGLESNFFGGYGFVSIAANPANSGMVIAGGRVSYRGVAQGVFRSTDYGQHWQNLNLNLGNDLTVWAVSFSPDGTEWLGTDHGNFRLSAK